MLLGPCGALAWACGPDDKPAPTCKGPSIVLVVEAENGRLPEDLLLNVRYGGNPDDGEAYRLGEDAPHQAVFCKLDPDANAPGGAAGDGAGGASAGGVKTLRCSLYTQGPASLDATAKGYESIEDEELKLTKDERCEHEIKVILHRALDAGG
jgi:hypothetical protein